MMKKSKNLLYYINDRQLFTHTNLQNKIDSSLFLINSIK